MRGYVRKRGKDSYSIAVSLGRDPATGKYKYVWVGVKGNKREAERRLSELLHRLDTGAFVSPSKTTVADYLRRWLQEYVRPNLSPRGFERYESIARVHLIPSLGAIALTQLRPEHLQRHYASKLNEGLSPRSVRYQHVVLHKALETAMKWGLVVRNVADGVDVPRSRRKDMQTWSELEVRHFLDVAKDSPYYPLFHTTLYTGMRRGELLALRWRDIGVQEIHVNRSLHQLRDGSYIFTQPKSAKSRRTIDLSPSSILAIAEHRERQEGIRIVIGVPMKQEDLVFSTPEGKPLRPNTVSRAWTVLAARAGLRAIRLHDARHTHASLMLKQGVHPKIVQERLGHGSIQVTLDTYSHVAPGLQKAAAESFDKLISPQYNDTSQNGVVQKNY
jgi:integrase